VRNAFKSRNVDGHYGQTVRVMLRNLIYVGAAVIVLVIWLGVGSSFAVAMSILGAGIAFASQEMIGSFMGYLFIALGDLYRIGDRVRVGGVAGDVLDISVMRTTLMEIGEWVHADQYTGRIVTVANRFVFAEPTYNYTRHWPYLWDEIALPVTYDSDWRHAQELMLAAGEQFTRDLQAGADASYARMLGRFAISPTTIVPTVYVNITDNWVLLTLRYCVLPQERRTVAAAIHARLLHEFEQDPGITVASVTIDIVGLPKEEGGHALTRTT